MTSPKRRATGSVLAQQLTQMTKVRVEYQDEANPWAQHVAYWPGNVRVPVAGDYICVGDGDDCRKVKTVLWSLDGGCVIRLEFHPLP